MPKIDWKNLEEIRRYKREQYLPVDLDVKRRHMREAALRRWAPGGSMREATRKRNEVRLAERLEKERQRDITRAAARQVFEDKERKRALAHYRSKGDARLDRPWDRRRSLELAMRRVINRPLKEKRQELDRLIKAAHSVVRKRKRHVQARLLRILRRRFQAAFRYGTNYSKTIRQLVGCPLDELRRHLESLWQPGMTWENYGFDGWHIDHKQPCASFDMSNESDRRQCFHYSNLQPLWAKQNFDKGTRICQSVDSCESGSACTKALVVFSPSA